MVVDLVIGDGVAELDDAAELGGVSGRDGVADLVELLDGAGRPAGAARRDRVHGECTPRHRAFSVYLCDPAGRVLLTRRALAKRTWPGVWSNACCGHPRPGEPAEAALVRRVREELGVDVTEVAVLLPEFSYQARDPSGVLENELCPVFRATLAAPGRLRPDPDEVMDVAWVAWDDLVQLAGRMPGVLSPWCARQVPALVADGLTPTAPAAGEDEAGADETGDAGVRVTLRGVDRLLHQVVDEVAGVWGRLGVPPAPLLAEDLPGWLGRLIGGAGKRIRPVMCHWGFVAAGGLIGEVPGGLVGEVPGGLLGGGRYEELVRAAAAVELLHEFALIHDDVMDDSDLRRGVPAAHRQAEQWHRAGHGRGDRAGFGRNLAVLLGDLALVEADRLAASLRPVLQREWHAMCVELVAGQRGDLAGAATGDVGVGDAERVAGLKSGAYTVSRPVVMGALAAGADEPAVGALRAYGAHAGAAFALRDDLLGVWGDPRVTGKPADDDLLSGKPTVLAALATERLTGTAAAALQRAGTGQMTSADAALVREAMAEAGIRDEVEESIRVRVGKAVDALNRGPLAPPGVAGLVEVTERLAWRTA